MRVLAVDTATEACSVALQSGDELIARYAEVGNTHAQKVLGMVEAVLAEAGVSLSMLDGIAASIGPGAFTGVRISVAVVQGLAFGAGLAVIPVTTLEALAYQIITRGAPRNGTRNGSEPRGARNGSEPRGAAAPSGAARALACLDARMGEIYWGCFVADTERGLAATSIPCVGPAGNVVLPDPGGYRGIGRGFAAYPDLAQLAGLELDPGDADALPNAREFARLGALRLRLREGVDPAHLTPLYLRDRVALTEAERARK